MEQEDAALKKFLTGGVFLLLGILLFNSFFVFSAGNNLDTRLVEAKELAKPAKVEIITLTSSCLDCFDIEGIKTTLKETNSLEIIKDETIDSDSEDARRIITQYEITKLPTIIIKGEIDKAAIQNFAKKNDALLFQGHSPPYVDAITRAVKGKVNTVVIDDKRCEECGSLSFFVQNIEQSGVVVAEQSILDASDKKAKDLITEMNIIKLPALLLSDDINVYPISDNLKKAGLSAKSGYYVIESSAPYVDAATGKVRGMVTLTMIDDQSCDDCYDVNIHKKIFAQMGLALNNTKTIDINSTEGAQLRVKYTLEKVPTVILTGDLKAYESLDQAWKKIGTIEDDGAYIFRNVELLGREVQYKDLTTGKITGLSVAQPTS